MPNTASCPSAQTLKTYTDTKAETKLHNVHNMYTSCGSMSWSIRRKQRDRSMSQTENKLSQLNEDADMCGSSDLYVDSNSGTCSTKHMGDIEFQTIHAK